MTVENYLMEMASYGKSRAQWGGWLEAAIMSYRWRARINVYEVQKGRYKLTHNLEFSGKTDYTIRLLWLGTHYDLLLPKHYRDKPQLR